MSLSKYFSGYQINNNEIGEGVCGVLGDERDAYRISVGKPEGRRSVGTPRG